jgi:hypothetical protein
VRAAASFIAVAGTLLLNVSPALATPRWNAGLETGICGRGGSVGFDGLAFCNAVHADLLLLRDGNGQLDLGPSLRLGTAGFDDLRLDPGVSLLLPVFATFPLVLEAGPHVRNFRELGVFGSAFFGLRSFNHYGSYDMSTGLLLMAERSFADGTPSALWLSARIDASWLALPFIFAYNAVR